MSKIYFISSIDTDCGKTIITGLLAKFLQKKGKSVITQKLVQTGCEGISDDIKKHRQLMGIDLLPVDNDMTTCPLVFKHPSSPELSASLENTDVNLQLINDATRKLSPDYEYILLEGAGGLMVPLTKDKMIIDYIKENKFDLFLVSSPRLGSINHSLLSIDACWYNGISLKAVIYNNYPVSDPKILNNSRKAIQKHLLYRYPGVNFADVPEIDPGQAPDLDFDLIF